MRVDAVQAQQVVAGGVLYRRGRVLADVQAQQATASAKSPGALDVGDEGLKPFVVEAQPVDQRLGLLQPEHPRPGVAGLALGRDGADLDEAEAHRAQAVDTAAVLVQACGQADAVGKLQPRHRHRIGAAGLRPQALCGRVLQRGDRVHRHVVGALGVQAKQEGAGQCVGDESHNRWIVPERFADPAHDPG